MLDRLGRARIVAAPGFDRWRIPPAALAIHLCIGQAYAFSIFKLPLTRLLGIHQSAPGDWTQLQVAWIFTLAIVSLGLSAALFGRWLERVGPRTSGVAAALCWGTGFFVAALGVHLHAIWLVYLGYGVIGGCGLGLGYITPVSTLIKWFPDRRGLATGLAIMGFGGGAFVASPLSQALLDHFATPTSTGVVESLCVLGTVYLLFMLGGAFAFRVPPPGYVPTGWSPPPSAAGNLYVPVEQAVRTRAFWLLWAVLLLNVTAGIGLLEQASPMVQELFPTRVGAGAAAGFVGLLSLFNMAGRFLWSSLSDVIGRRVTYAAFFTLGAVGYGILPLFGELGHVIAFVAIAALLMTLYGGGFATIPSYLSDLFGTQQVGAIHGRLLTAWSAAGVAGPVLVNALRQSALDRGLSAPAAYALVLRIVAGLLVVGFVANLLVRPVPGGLMVRGSEAPAARGAGQRADPATTASPRGKALLLAVWTVVLIPLGWGVAMTAIKASALFVR